MAMGTERSKALHNFTMPCELRWGNQRSIRCMKVNSGSQISASRRVSADSSYSSDQRRHSNSVQQRRTTRDIEKGREKESSSKFLHGSRKMGPTQPPASDGGQRFSHNDDGIAAMRKKVLSDLQTAADKMKVAIFKDGIDEDEVSGSPPPPPPSTACSAEREISRPWNLRTRRATCKTPVSRFVSSKNGGATAAVGANDNSTEKGLAVDVLKPNSGFSPTRAGLAASADKSPRVKSGGGSAAANVSGEKRERPKFSVALSRKDIEEDFLELVNHRPPRRPKKRAKIIQRQLDALFPGVWLTEVTPDMYKVPDAAP